MRRVLPTDEVVFKAVRGFAVPCQPWPQKFIVTRTLLHVDAVEVRPLTLTGFVKGVSRNFLTMNWWRLLWLLRCLGFLSTKEACMFQWRDLTFRFWRHQQVHRFRWVRRVKRLRERWRPNA